MSHIEGRHDADLHNPDGSHKTTAATTSGRALERHERRIQAHLREHEAQDADEPTYRIVRFYQDHEREVVTTGLTREQAMEHCNSPETSSSTATGEHAVERTKRMGHWFDGFEEE